MSVFITAMNAGTTDQSHVLKVYEIVNEVVQQFKYRYTAGLCPSMIS